MPKQGGNIIHGADAFRERRIKALADRITAEIKAGRKAEARALWPRLQAACLSRSPVQVARMERRIFGRAA